MPRSGEEARRRLQQAALQLYEQRGFDRTTTAEIAARAGVTERTFFRHFPDKREVLFDGEATLRADLTRSVADAPEGLPPLEVLIRAFRKAGSRLEENRPFAEPRLAVIAATPALRERDLAKAAAMADALAAALRERGVGDRLAALAAHVGWVTFHHAAGAWIRESERSLDEHLDEAFADLRALSAEASG
ncbi:TetR family transcriptional regulator [Amycolatopsis sp. NPDC058278]|uniref:TetR family transcriptional regulator n=1 Tax=Amycolatopsis sp. NPDC058278 TaxID=3346417 RepID=UPI0036D7AB58